MFHYLEGVERARIPEASGELVKPFKKVVAVAMQRVRRGTIDSLNRQTVELSDKKNSNVYIITDVSVEETSGGVRSKGNLDSGLFIHVIQLVIGNQFTKLLSIQLPREPDRANKESLFLQRGSNPKEVDKLANALSSARKL